MGAPFSCAGVRSDRAIAQGPICVHTREPLSTGCGPALVCRPEVLRDSGVMPLDGPFIGSEALAPGLVTKHHLRARCQAVFPDVYLLEHLEPTLAQPDQGSVAVVETQRRRCGSRRSWSARCQVDTRRRTDRAGLVQRPSAHRHHHPKGSAGGGRSPAVAGPARRSEILDRVARARQGATRGAPRPSPCPAHRPRTSTRCRRSCPGSAGCSAAWR